MSADVWWEPPNATTADLRRLVKKCGDALTLVCTRGKETTNKFVGPNVTFSAL